MRQVKMRKIRESGGGEGRFACKTRNMIVDRVGKGGAPAESSGTAKQTREKERKREDRRR